MKTPRKYSINIVIQYIAYINFIFLYIYIYIFLLPSTLAVWQSENQPITNPFRDEANHVQNRVEDYEIDYRKKKTKLDFLKLLLQKLQSLHALVQDLTDLLLLGIQKASTHRIWIIYICYLITMWVLPLNFLQHLIHTYIDIVWSSRERISGTTTQVFRSIN